MTMIEKIIEFQRLGGDLWIYTADDRHFWQFAYKKDIDLIEQLGLPEGTESGEFTEEDINFICSLFFGGGNWVTRRDAGYLGIKNPYVVDLGDELEQYQA